MAPPTGPITKRQNDTQTIFIQVQSETPSIFILAEVLGYFYQGKSGPPLVSLDAYGCKDGGKLQQSLLVLISIISPPLQGRFQYLFPNHSHSHLTSPIHPIRRPRRHFHPILT